MAKKYRAINKSKNDKKRILELYDKGMKPAEIQKYFGNKYTYWQIYNTINPRELNSCTDETTEDNTITEMPQTDLSQFPGITNFIEHQITVLLAQLNLKNIGIERRTRLLKQITDISIKLKTQQIEQYLKEAKAKLILRMMRRLKSDITDEEILKIYKEEAEKLKNEN
jgi:hypothetical protein